MLTKIQKIMFLTFMASLMFPGTARARDPERKYSIELSWERNDWILKFRPFDYTYLSRTQRMDFLVGKRFRLSFGDFRAFGYFKFDNKDKSWLGTRLDYGLRTLKQRLLLDLELRFFQGLNERSKNHFYVIPTAYYKFDQKGRFIAGLSGYGKKIVREAPFFYIGLDALVRLNKHIRALVSYSTDAYGAGVMIWWIIYVDF